MEFLIGLILSVAVAGAVAIIGLDRERAYFPTVMIVIAFYYVLFAVMGASTRVLVIEIIIACGFSTLAVLGFKRGLWLVAAALIGHGLFDIFHHSVIDNPGVPKWWPGFCMTFDVIFGTFLAMRLIKKSTSNFAQNSKQ